MGIHNFTRSRNQAPWNIADPGTGKALPNDRSGTINIVTGSSGETNTLAAPIRAGLELAINMLTDGGGDRVITVASAFDPLGTTAITLSAAGDYYLLRSFKFGSVYRWRLVAMPALASMAALTATAAELNKLDDSLATNLMTRGAGVDTAESYAAGVFRNGTLIHTRIVVDLSTLIGSATDLDIIGESAAASCHWGQLTTAINGTLIGGKITCLELPAGGADDIDFYSSTVSTGTQDVIITDAALGTETALVTSGAAWASGTTKGMTGLPTANDYLYIVNGEAAGGTFTAGKFLIEFFGYAA
jgi:hypothetical protein